MRGPKRNRAEKYTAPFAATQSLSTNRECQSGECIFAETKIHSLLALQYNIRLCGSYILPYLRMNDNLYLSVKNKNVVSRRRRRENSNSGLQRGQGSVIVQENEPPDRPDVQFAVRGCYRKLVSESFKI